MSVAAAIFFFALVLRLIGIGWGLKNDFHNQSYHPDEPVVFAYSQAIEPTKLQFTPGFYNYGTLYLTMLRITSDMTAAYTGGPDMKSDDSYWSFVSRVHFAGRILSALAGAATALILFLIGLRFFGMLGGIASGLAIAVASGHAVHSRFQTVDIIATFFLAASALYALKLLDEDKEGKFYTKAALLAGVFAGLGAGTKYTGILALLTVLVAVEVVRRKRNWSMAEALKLDGAAIASALVVFLVTTPGVLLDTEKFMRDFKYEMTHTATGHGLVFAGSSPGFLYHLGNLFSGVGILLTLLGIGGLVWAAAKRNWWALALLAFFLPYYLLIGRAEVKFLRYTFPLYVGIAAGFGYLISESQKNERWKKAGVVFGILAIGGIDTGGLMGAAKATGWMAGEDPRDSGAKFVKKEGALTVGYAKDPWTWSVPIFKDSTLPRMPMGPAYLGQINAVREQTGLPQGWQAWFLARMTLMAKEPMAVLFFSGMSEGAEVQYKDFDERLISDLRPEYVTLTSLEVGPLDRLRRTQIEAEDLKNAVAQYSKFREALEKDYSRVAAFGAIAPTVEDMQYVQPEVLVWKRKTPGS